MCKLNFSVIRMTSNLYLFTYIQNASFYCRAHSDIAGTLSGHASWVLSVSFSEDGKHFTSSSSDKTVKIWDVAERKCVHTFTEHADQVWGVKYSPDSNKVVSVSEDRSINLYDCPANIV